MPTHRGRNFPLGRVLPPRTEKETDMARELLQEIIETFPQVDPASEFYNEEINGCEAVNFLSQFIPRIREYLDAPPPKVAVILDGGLVECLTADRPNDVLPITF